MNDVNRDKNIENKNGTERQTSRFVTERCRRRYLHIPCKYRISGQEKAVDWMKQKRKATTFLQEHSLDVKKCLGKKYKWEKLFMCPLYGGRLWSKCSCGTWKKCPLCGVSTLERFCYKGFLRNSSGTRFFVRLREVSGLEDVCLREARL